MSGGGEKAAASGTRMSVYKHGEWQEERLIRANPAAFGPELRKPRANVREIMNGAQRGSLSGSWGLQRPKGCCMVSSVCLALFSSAITAPKSLLATSRTNRLSIKGHPNHIFVMFDKVRAGPDSSFNLLCLLN